VGEPAVVTLKSIDLTLLTLNNCVGEPAVVALGSPTQQINTVKSVDFRATTAGSPTQHINTVKSVDFRATTAGSPTQHINTVKSVDFRATTAGSPTRSEINRFNIVNPKQLSGRTCCSRSEINRFNIVNPKQLSDTVKSVDFRATTAGSPTQLFSTLMILKAACMHNQCYIDRLITTFMKVLHKMAREQIC
jgi:hypothetical protein